MSTHKLAELPKLLASGNLDRIWFVTGIEPLLQLEAIDAIRAACFKEGFEDRVVLDLAGKTDWSTLRDSACDVGLFCDKKIIEVRVPSGKPGTAGANAIQDYLKLDIEGVATIFEIPETDWQVSKSVWYKALSQVATTIKCDPIARSELPNWIADRLSLHNQKATRETLEYFADLVEGNLFAARQEVDKLALLYPEGELTTDDILDAVSNSSRFETQGLLSAIATGAAEKACRIIDSLKEQGEAIPFLLVILTSFLRNVIRKHYMIRTRQQFMKGFFPTPEVNQAVRKISEKRALVALRSLADVDKLAKGIESKDKDTDVWLELKSIAIFLAK